MKIQLTAALITAMAVVTTSSITEENTCTLQHVIYQGTDGTHREEARCAFGSDKSVLISGGQRHEDTQEYFLSKFRNGDLVAGLSTMFSIKGTFLDRKGGKLYLHEDTDMAEDIRTHTPSTVQQCPNQIDDVN